MATQDKTLTADDSVFAIVSTWLITEGTRKGAKRWLRAKGMG